MIILSINSRLGEKVNILIDRLMELWDGKASSDPKKKANVKVSQPIAGKLPPMLPPQNSNQSFSDGTAINSLPTNAMMQMNNQPTTFIRLDAIYG